MSNSLSNALPQSWDSARETLRPISESSELLLQSVTEALRESAVPAISPAKLFVWTSIGTLFIGLVSAYDIYLTIAYWVSLWEMEFNPIAHRVLFPEDVNYGHDVRLALFIGLKTAGTIVVISVMQLMAALRYKYTLPVLAAVSVAQFILLCFFAAG